MLGLASEVKWVVLENRSPAKSRNAEPGLIPMFGSMRTKSVIDRPRPDSNATITVNDWCERALSSSGELDFDSRHNRCPRIDGPRKFVACEFGASDVTSPALGGPLRRPQGAISEFWTSLKRLVSWPSTRVISATIRPYSTIVAPLHGRPTTAHGRILLF